MLLNVTNKNNLYTEVSLRPSPTRRRAFSAQLFHRGRAPMPDEVGLKMFASDRLLCFVEREMLPAFGGFWSFAK